MNHLGGASETEAYIASIWSHLQVNYCHSTLGSKVLVERLPGIKHYAGMTLKGDKPNGVASLKSMYTNTENDLNGADLMLYMGFIGAGFTQGGGIAYLAVVCNNLNDKQKKKQSINNYGSRKYLVFVSSRSVKMRGSSAFSVCRFLRKVDYVKQNIIVHFILKN